MKRNRKYVRITRLIARLWSIAGVAFVLLIVVGELLWPTGPAPTSQEWLGLALFPIGVTAGLVLGWWSEPVGGTVAIASLVGFYMWEYAVSGDLAGGPFFILVALPGILYLIAWYGSRQESIAQTAV